MSAAEAGRLLNLGGETGCDGAAAIGVDLKKGSCLLNLCAASKYQGTLFTVGAVEAQGLCNPKELTQAAVLAGTTPRGPFFWLKDSGTRLSRVLREGCYG